MGLGMSKWYAARDAMLERHESVDDIAIREERRLFLVAAAEHPKIRLGESLHDDVFLPLRKLWTELRLYDLEVLRSDNGERFLSRYEEKQNDLLKKWITRHHLAFEWICEEAINQVTSWSGLPTMPPFSGMPGYHPPNFFLDNWFSNESEQHYRRRMFRKFDDLLGPYMRDVKRSRKLLLRDRGSQSTHYAWAAMRVCLKQTWREIADHHALTAPKVTPQAVSKAVSPILERLASLTAAEGYWRDLGVLRNAT
jgi:hypothetical protein